MGKSIFAVNLPLKLFPATVANVDIESLKSLHTFLKGPYADHILIPQGSTGSSIFSDIKMKVHIF